MKEKKINYLTLRQIQLAELKILKTFIRICEENRLRYFLYGGTALGAIRHKGFIPWDDDIDVIMPRPDYEKLCNLVKNNKICEENILLELPEITKNPRFLIGKMYDTSIKVEAKNKINNGSLWIDIMQLDGLPERHEKYLRKVTILRKLFFHARSDRFFTKEGIKEKGLYSFLRRIFDRLTRIVNYDKLTHHVLNFCKKYNYETAQHVCNNAWYTTPSKIFEKKWFRDTVKAKFEDIEADVCVDYDKFLSKRYGKNYMEIPPKSEQLTHSFEAWRIDDKE